MDFTLILIIATLITGILSIIRLNNSALQSIREFSSSVFPILLVVLLIRSFLIEPYKIPSGSMIPTLMIGDFILVDKNIYGYKIPLTDITLIDNEDPQRGDVVVFKYPENKKINYIKRIIGLPGDIILINNKKLKVNGKEIQKTQVSNDLPYLFTEDIDDKKIYILEDLSEKTSELKYVVPQNSYFVMGDNRDRSSDSRYWGFVPESNLVGKASLIWFSLGENIRFDNKLRLGINLNSLIFLKSTAYGIKSQLFLSAISNALFICEADVINNQFSFIFGLAIFFEYIIFS